ncbi:MAG: acetyl-CoA carboxylase, carboxyltransferase subunit beta [Holosporales bacterium]|jgi:acetyl-CoA carboxylase carboxyl transferase subunit beta|nr:acetyl-CoA carboxylase, carboxyltransferase subunit beta [Holosporales bacterium]
MNWISEFVTPKVKAFIEGVTNQTSDTLWAKCKECEKMVYLTDLVENDMICPNCDNHFELPSDKRLHILFDDGEFQNIPISSIKDDPIKFRDSKKYTDRLKDARKKTGNQDACSIGYGKIGGTKAVVFVMNFSFMGGSMGLSVGKSFNKAIDIAIKKNAAFIAFTASGGARMQEGMLSLMQMAGTIAGLCLLKEKKIPFINIFTNPTTGGVLASFAMLGDINISEPNALIGFAGARVIEKTIKQKLPDNFQKAEFLKDHGMIDMICHRRDLRTTISTILSNLMKK